MQKLRGVIMEVLYFLAQVLAASAIVLAVLKFYDDKIFSNKLDLISRIDSANNRAAAAVDMANKANSLVNVNSNTVGKAYALVEKTRADLFCENGLLDTRDAKLRTEFKELETVMDNVQEYCMKLRENQMDFKEILAGRRPIMKFKIQKKVDEVKIPPTPFEAQ